MVNTYAGKRLTRGLELAARACAEVSDAATAQGDIETAVIAAELARKFAVKAQTMGEGK